MMFQLSCSILAEYTQYAKLENVHKQFAMDTNTLEERS